MALKIEIKDYDSGISNILLHVIEVSYSQNSIKFTHINNDETIKFTPLNGELSIINIINGRNYTIERIIYKETT